MSSITQVSPVVLTDEQDDLTGPLVGRSLPVKFRRQERPDSQLTVGAAVALAKTGRVTKRDYRIIQTVWMMGIITTGQIQRLIFHTLKDQKTGLIAARRRLNILFQEYCLDRVFISYDHELVYTAGRLGIYLIQLEQRKTGREIKWSDRGLGEKLLLLDHYLEVTEFAVKLTEEVRQQGGSLSWLGENVITLRKRDGSFFEPDGIGYISLDDRRLPFFLEWDRGGEGVFQLAGKFRNYIDLMTYPDGWRGNFSKFPPILLATNTFTRVEKVMAEVDRLTRPLGESKAQFVVLLTTHDTLAKHGILGPCWWQVGRTEKKDVVWGSGLRLLDFVS